MSEIRNIFKSNILLLHIQLGHKSYKLQRQTISHLKILNAFN